MEIVEDRDYDVSEAAAGGNYDAVLTHFQNEELKVTQIHLSREAVGSISNTFENTLVNIAEKHYDAEVKEFAKQLEKNLDVHKDSLIQGQEAYDRFMQNAEKLRENYNMANPQEVEAYHKDLEQQLRAFQMTLDSQSKKHESTLKANKMKKTSFLGKLFHR